MAQGAGINLNGDVFGKPVTIEVLSEIPDYAKNFRIDTATMALEWIEIDGKKDQVLEYVNKLKDEWGTGVSTLCMVYNATGETLTYSDIKHDWYGHIYKKYPNEIKNGQWGGFLHVKTSGVPSGSEAAVVFHGKKVDGQDTDWMLAWDNPWAPHQNNAYTEINQRGYFDNINWETIETKLSVAGAQHRAEWEGCVSEVSIEDGTSPFYQAVLKLKLA